MADISKIDGTPVANVAKVMGRTVVPGDSMLGILFPSIAPLIQSIRAFDITINDASATGTDTITSVDKSLSAVYVTGSVDANTLDDLDRSSYHVVLTNGTTVTATRVATDGAIASITGYIVTFNSTFVKEVHHGTVTIAGGSSSQVSGTFNATEANCAALHCGGSTSEPSDFVNDVWANIIISGSDTAVSVTAQKFSTGDATTISFNILEFQSSAINQIQEVVLNMNNGVGPTSDATISSVDTSKTMMLWGGIRPSSFASNLSSVTAYAELTSSTNIKLTRDGTAGSVNVTVTSIEFNDAVFQSVERITSSFGDAETTDNVTLSTTLTDTSLAFVSKLGFNVDAAVAGWKPSVHCSTTNITSTTNIANIRSAAEALTPNLTNSYEVYQV